MFYNKPGWVGEESHPLFMNRTKPWTYRWENIKHRDNIIIQIKTTQTGLGTA